MLRGMTDPVLSALEKYERDPAKNEKKAVLLTPQGGYFLYGNRFCSISDYQLEFQSDSIQIQGNCVQRPIFLGVLQDGFHAVGDKPYKVERVGLIFHIDLGEGDVLRGILLVLEQDSQFVIACDEAVEEMYRLLQKMSAGMAPQILLDSGLREYAENLRQRDLHGLIELYLRGKPVKSIFVENS